MSAEKVKNCGTRPSSPCCEPMAESTSPGRDTTTWTSTGTSSETSKGEGQVVRRSRGWDTPPEKFSSSFEEKRNRWLRIFNAQYQNDTSLMKGHIFKETGSGSTSRTRLDCDAVLHRL